MELSESKRDFDIAGVFHLRGGIEYKNLHLKHKVMMKMLLYDGQENAGGRAKRTYRGITKVNLCSPRTKT